MADWQPATLLQGGQGPTREVPIQSGILKNAPQPLKLITICLPPCPDDFVIMVYLTAPTTCHHPHLLYEHVSPFRRQMLLPSASCSCLTFLCQPCRLVSRSHLLQRTMISTHRHLQPTIISLSALYQQPAAYFFCVHLSQ